MTSAFPIGDGDRTLLKEEILAVASLKHPDLTKDECLYIMDGIIERCLVVTPEGRVTASQVS